MFRGSQKDIILNMGDPMCFCMCRCDFYMHDFYRRCL